MKKWRYLKRFENFPDYEIEWGTMKSMNLISTVKSAFENYFEDLGNLTDDEAQIIMDHLDRDEITKKARESTDGQIIYSEVQEEIAKQINDKDLLTIAGVYKRLNQERFDL